MCSLHIRLELETANVGSFIKANSPLRVDTRFCWHCEFFSTGVSVHGKCTEVRVRVWSTSHSAFISCVTLGMSLNFFELLNQGSQHPPVYFTELL